MDASHAADAAVLEARAASAVAGDPQRSEAMEEEKTSEERAAKLVESWQNLVNAGLLMASHGSNGWLSGRRVTINELLMALTAG